MKNILITGANGLIGREISRDLSQLDLNFHPVFRKKDSNNIKDKDCIYADISEKDWTRKLPGKIDTVLHLANSSQFREFPEGVDDVLNVNIRATIELLEWSRKVGVKKFIFTSTGNVYKNSKKKLTEDSPCLPDSMYAASKLSLEYFVEMYSAFFKTIILRPFGVYGNAQRHGLFHEIVNKVKTNKVITLNNGTGLKITPIHVSDASKAILFLMNEYLMKENHLVLNLASNEKTNVKKIAEMAAKRLEVKPIFDVNDIPNSSYLADISYLEKIWPEKKKLSLTEGIDMFVRRL